jgi:type II secretory pathway pseudopilin PulG
MNRSAFSLIELVFAIVIIAISVMTIPLMLSQSSNNDSFSIMQESILAARTKIGNVLSWEWDRNSSVGTGYIRVLDVKNGDSELDRNHTDVFRLGHLNYPKRRRFHDGNLTDKTFPSNVVDNVNIEAISDFDTNVTAMDANSSLDYVTDFNITTSVSYISDIADYNATTINFGFNVAGESITDINKSTNIKMVEVLVETVGGNPFRFRTFSCNLGQTDYEEVTP